MRLCETCCTKHPETSICPPHECRPTGMARYHIWMKYLETENERLKAVETRLIEMIESQGYHCEALDISCKAIKGFLEQALKGD